MQFIYKSSWCGVLALLLLVTFQANTYAQDHIRQINPKKEAVEAQVVNGDFLTEVKNPQIDSIQMSYYERMGGFEKSTHMMSFYQVNPDILKSNKDLTLGIPELKNMDIYLYEMKELDHGRFIWKGKSKDGLTTAKFVVNGDLITGNIQTTDHILQLRPLTKGLHVLKHAHMDEDHHCGYHDAMMPAKGMTKSKNRPFNPAPDDLADLSKSYSGECKVRLMVVYTNAVDAAHPNIADLVELEIDNFNEINSNSNVDFRVELARSVEVNYTETNQELQHPDVSSWDISRDLYRLWHPSDGWMDDIHDQRNLYDADMVVFMVDRLPGYGGLAFNVGVDQSDAFCIMRYDNGNHTFTHEFGHLIGMWHNTENSPGPSSSVVPFSYGYGHYWTGIGPNFRTVMSYSSPCGTSGCPRITYWSNPNLDYGPYNIALGTSTKNNARVAREQQAVIAGFQSTITNKNVFLSHNVRIRETGNIIANSSISTDNNTIRYYNGSSGTYKAPDLISFKPGFRAYSGSTFRAKIENCSAVSSFVGSDEPITAAAQSQEETATSLASPSTTTSAAGSIDLLVSPNPVKSTAMVSFSITKESYVELSLYDLSNRKLKTLISQNNLPIGPHQVALNTNDLPSGVYLARLIVGNEMQTKRVIVSK
ncbi:MAG: zinc-dependent metalloprotease [Bacteroidota bacterium]